MQVVIQTPQNNVFVFYLKMHRTWHCAFYGSHCKSFSHSVGSPFPSYQPGSSVYVFRRWLSPSLGDILTRHTLFLTRQVKPLKTYLN